MARYPQIEPYDSGHLDVGDGQLIYWEVCGNPAGKPAVVLHGGPGSGCGPGARRRFDPAAYRIVLVDQRGCGRSLPHAGDPEVSLETNTTWHLVADLEKLREHLGIERWLLWGASWGSTLALAYAQTHPERVSEIVIAAVTVSRYGDFDWLTRGVGRFFPEQWEAFRDVVPPAERDGDLAAAYSRMLESGDPVVRSRAEAGWVAWEDAMLLLENGGQPSARFADPTFRTCFTRIVTHYWSHRSFLEDGQLLRDAHRLAGIPGVLIHGRLDLGGPLEVPWLLHKAWPGSELTVLDDAGHTTMSLGDLVGEATDRFRPV